MAWIAQLVGTGVQMYGQNDAARAGEAQSNFQTAQLEQNAGSTQASFQRTAEDKRRQATLLASRVQALAGGGAGDVSVVKTIADISAEGEYRALSALYEGDVQAQEMRNRAKARVFEGGQMRKANNLAAAGTIFSTGASLYSKYGGNGSPTAGADRSGFRSDDPYSSPDYFGGGEGE